MTSYLVLLTLAAILLLTAARPFHEDDDDTKQQVDNINHLTKTILLEYRHRHYRKYVFRN